MKDFKYPIHRMFFDVDGVACTFLSDVVIQFPDKKEELEDLSWDISSADGSDVAIVLAIADIEDVISEEENADDTL